jgi:hypothetical protein
MSVEGVNYRNIDVNYSASKNDRKEQVATGVGVGAGLNQAGKFLGKRALKANGAMGQVAQAENSLQTMMTNVNRVTQTARRNAQVTEGLWATFKSNIKFYTKDIMTRLESLKGVKFVGKIVNSPIAKKGASVVGGALAFFVLVTGLSKAAKTGQIAIDDFQNKYYG